MNPILTFTKRIKDQSISFKEIKDNKDIAKIGEVIEKLENLSGIRSSNLSDLGLRTNPKNWASSVLRNFPDQINKQEMQYLIADFTDSMQTRMRMDTKYALGILMDGRLVLCHSVFGEETITPEWKTIPRMLDSDNILRFVGFSNASENIVVKYWEKEATGSFVEWLGLPRKQIFLLGGNYKLRTEIDNMSVEFQMDDEEVGVWLAAHPEVRDGYITLSSPIQSLNIKDARAGRKLYEDMRDFIQDYEAETFGMPKYHKEYQKIKASNLPLLMKHYDEKERVVRVEGDDKTTAIDKSTPGFNILFADGEIEIRPSYLNEIVSKIKNKENQKIVHAGHKFASPPFILGATQIYNQIEINSAVRLLTDYYNETNLQDVNLNTLFLFVVFSLLSCTNMGSPFSYVFQEIASGLVAKQSFNKRISKTEDGILEYKSRDIFSGKSDEIANELAKDIQVKLQTSPCKVYCIGIEDNGKVNPINPSRMRSDRIEQIKQGLINRIPNRTIHSMPIIQGDEGLMLYLIY